MRRTRRDRLRRAGDPARRLVDTPHCLGVELTVFDPDYDPDGLYAAEIVNTVVAGLAPVSAPAAAPPRLLPAASEPPSPRRGNGRPTEPGLLAAPAPTVTPAPAIAVEPAGPVGPGLIGSGPLDSGRQGVGGPEEPIGGSRSAGPRLLRTLPWPEEETAGGPEPDAPQSSPGIA